MRRKQQLASVVRSLFVLLPFTFCLLPYCMAQQPTATSPQQPTAPGQSTSPPRAPAPSQPASKPSPPTTRREILPPPQQRADRPPPYYAYPFGSTTTRDRLLTLDEAIALALSQASAYQQSQLDERVAAEDVKQARAAFLPQFTMPLTYFGTTPSQVRAEDEPLTFSFVSSSAINETIALFSASGEIDLSGRLRSALRRSRQLLTAARAGTLAARRTLVIATVDAYYGLMLARQKRRLAEETLGLAEGFVKITEANLQRGESEESDVIRAQAAAVARRDELEQARAGEAAAQDVLRTLTGVDYATHIDVSRITQDVPAVSDFISYTEELIKTRPELSQLDAQKRAALHEASMARSERFPQLTYTLNGGFDAGDTRQLRRYSGGSAIITLSIPVFDFGASKSREAQARLRAQSLENQRENTLRQIRQEFYSARAAAFSAIERIRQTETGATAAQQNVNTIFMRYRLNKATILDVIDAQAAYATARLAYYQAIADYHTSRVRLEPTTEQMASRPQAQPGLMSSARQPRCTLSMSQAPELYGLRLGMNLSQVMSRFPNLKVPEADEFGVASVMLREDEIGNMAADNLGIDRVANVTLEFTDGRLSFIRLGYPATNRWNSTDEFIAAVAERLNLPGGWKGFYDLEMKNFRATEDFRDRSLECSGFRISIGIGVEAIGAQPPHIKLEDMAAAQRVKARMDEKSRREAGQKQQNPKD